VAPQFFRKTVTKNEEIERGDINPYFLFKAKKLVIIQVLIVICIVVSLLSLGMGAYKLSMWEVISILLNNDDAVFGVVIWDIRLPRIFAAVIVGSALAISGAVMQCILRNPLASPYTLGISSAAAFGASISIAASYMSWFNGTWLGDALCSMYGMSFFAFLFSIVSVTVIVLLSRNSEFTPESIILAGVAMSSIFTAALSSLQYIVDDRTLQAIVFWQFGDLSKATWSDISLVLAFLLLISVFFIYHRLDYNSIEAGCDVAKSLGVDTKRLTILSMVFASILAALCVSMVGIIGFVGLLGPHLMRRLIGGDYRHLLPASMVMGSLVLLLSDAVGRIPFESPVPVGIITSLLGGPMFLYMLIKKDWGGYK
jgi:iron complex transport system permease protein